MEFLPELATGAGLGGVLAGVLYLLQTQSQKSANKNQERFLNYVEKVDARESEASTRERELSNKAIDVIEKNTQAFQEFARIMKKMQESQENAQINLASVLDRATTELGKAFERSDRFEKMYLDKR